MHRAICLYSMISQQRELHQGVVDTGELAAGSIHVETAISELINAV